jgi:hypothetical protein
MGFRDVELFNQAMLGRQCWRILTNPNFLCTRVLQGLYFPDGDFWKAKCPRSAFYNWRSILHGRKLVEKGILWGIGNGATTVKPLVPLSDGQTVASLSLITSRAWSEQVVQATFPEDIPNIIFQIPISRTDGNDFITWPHNKNIGVYTVRSAYYLGRQEAALVSRSNSSRGMSSSSSMEATI